MFLLCSAHHQGRLCLSVCLPYPRPQADFFPGVALWPHGTQGWRAVRETAFFVFRSFLVLLKFYKQNRMNGDLLLFGGHQVRSLASGLFTTVIFSLTANVQSSMTGTGRVAMLPAPGCLCCLGQPKRISQSSCTLVRVVPKALAQFSLLPARSTGRNSAISPLGSHLTGQHHSLDLVQVPAAR